MGALYRYRQEKKERGVNESKCVLNLRRENNLLIYESSFDLSYKRYGEKKHIVFDHMLKINLDNGDIDVLYKITNDGVTQDSFFRNIIKYKKNDFHLLEELSDAGFYKGERKSGYWGVNYKRATNNIFEIVYSTLSPKFKTNYYKKKKYEKKYHINSFYDLIVDFHLNMKGIKSHDSVYLDILEEYPSKKLLKVNGNKFLPAILDKHKIKCKYFIGELSNKSVPACVKSLKYLCTLFGDNYIDYLKQTPWKNHSYHSSYLKCKDGLKNNDEKRYMVKTMKNWYIHDDSPGLFIIKINKLLTIRKKLESFGHQLKYDAKNNQEVENLINIWDGIKKHHGRGHKLKYVIDENFKDSIEENIIIENEMFKPKLLLTEEEYIQEGHLMKNCMSKQYPHGAIYLYVSLQNKRKRINLQYKKGNLVQSLGKANTPTLKIFDNAIKILNSRFERYPEITWTREKYDYLKK